MRPLIFVRRSMATAVLALGSIAGVAAHAAGVAHAAGEAPSPVRADPVDQPALTEPLAARSLLLDVARAGSRLVAVGERGHVLLSDDSGKTWRQAKSVPTRAMLTAVTFADAKTGWAVGHDEVILNTVDGGETWTRTHYAPEAQQPLLDVWFADATRGIAVGAYGSYFDTTDGGRHWTSRKFASTPLRKPAPRPAGEQEDVPPEYHLNKIAAAGARLFIAAEAGQLYRSDDGGTTWLSLPSGYNGSFFGLLPLSEQQILAFGLRGNLYRTTDGGATWSRVDVATTAMLTDGVRARDGSLALVGLSGTVLTAAGGADPGASASWTLRQQADRKGLSAVLAEHGAGLVVVGEDGTRTVALR